MAIFRCGECGGINRVPEARIEQHPKCGRCKHALDVEGEVQAVDGKALRATIAAAPVPVLVDFWAEWCGPCRMAGPIVEAIARDRAGEMITLKLDTDADPQTSQSLQIQGIPTFILFVGGKEIARQSGVMPPDAMKKWIASHATRAPEDGTG